MADHILIRYGELSLKKSNRRQFVAKITSNIKRALRDFKELTYESRGMRFYIILNEIDSQLIIPILQKIPGLYSFSVVSRCRSNLDDIKELAYHIVANENINSSFKIETNRADKTFPLTSIEISKEVGRHLFKNILGLKADVHHPDYILDIDVRQEGTFIFTEIIYGLGGFPAGSMGKAILMISGGIDSVVAGWLAIKKGITVEAIHFASPPYTSDLAVQKVIDLLEKLTPYTEYQNINLHIIPFTSIQKAIYDNCRDDYGITIMRRMMYRITEKLANQKGLLAIINGENVGQVASQTLESMRTIEQEIQIPVLRPLAMFDKQEIIAISEKIDTFNISIRPYEDCCTVFVPKHPQIKPDLEKTIKEEEKFDYRSLIEEALQNRQYINLKFNKHYNIFDKDNEFDDLF